jgi:plasmid stabilization system protein ParE
LNRRLIIVPEARIEIAEAVQQYEGKAPGLGRRFWRETKRCLADVRDNPFHWRAISPKFRRAVMRVFPYLVFFRVTDEEVRVLDVLHGARDYERILAQSETGDAHSPERE